MKILFFLGQGGQLVRSWFLAGICIGKRFGGHKLVETRLETETLGGRPRGSKWTRTMAQVHWKNALHQLEGLYVEGTSTGYDARGLLMARIRRVAIVSFAMAALGSTGLAVSYLRASGAPRQERNSTASGREEGGDSLPDGAVRRLGILRFNHGGDIKTVHFALGGKALLSAGRDGIIRVWDVKTGAERYAIAKGRLHFYSSGISHDGASLMTCGEDGLSRLWDLESGRELRDWQPPEANGRVDSIAFSPDAKTVATAGRNDRAASLWNVTRNEPPRRLVGIERGIWDIVFSPDGKTIATAAADGIARGGAFADAPPAPDEDPERGSIRLWDVDKGFELRCFPVKGCQPRCVAFSADGSTLAAGFSDATIRLYDPVVGTERAKLDVQGPSQGCMSFSPDGRILASGTHPGMSRGGDPASIHLWDVARATEIRQFAAHDMLVNGLSFSPDGKVLA
jgi:WD40 repeat protein